LLGKIEGKAIIHPVKPERILVFSSLFPSSVSPTSGTFIRERLFRVHQRKPIIVVAPQVWSPFDPLVRVKRPNFRLQAKEFEVMEGVEVYRPRFFSLPAVGKTRDGLAMATAAMSVVRELQKKYTITLVDAHFLFPDGWAAARVAKALDVPLTITLRGSKDEWLIGTSRQKYLVEAMHAATKLFAVSAALKRDVAVKLGIDAQKVRVIGNGVDLEKFTPMPRDQARAKLNLPLDAKVLISVGSLIERKGFHRVIPLLVGLRKTYPTLKYLVVGGGASHGDMSQDLRALTRQHGLEDVVVFCGAQVPTELKWYYSAADVFTLATAHEGWANVFLEAMGCGLPVISTKVGGNDEVVPNDTVGQTVKYFDAPAFESALSTALARDWDRQAIVAYAQSNTWDQRIDVLISEFNALQAGQHEHA
jgi:teichuronic acid biosynthesis glycosyltransferase TuaC